MNKKQKRTRVNESTSCLSVNDLVRLNARIYEILHINSNIGFCFTRQKNVKKTQRRTSNKKNEDRLKKKLFMLPRREVEKEKKSP